MFLVDTEPRVGAIYAPSNKSERNKSVVTSQKKKKFWHIM